MPQIWYYALDRQQLGPVSEEEMDRLAASGTIRGNTLVWHAGMPGWEPYNAARGPEANAGPLGFCSQCSASQPFSEMVRFGDDWVCAACKEPFTQRLRETGLVAQKFRYAGFWIRVLAKLIDSAILIAVYMPVSYLTSPMLLRTAGSGTLTPGFFLLEGGLLLFQIVGSGAYDIFFVWKYSATPGKMICGKKIVTAEGGRLTLGRATGRYFANYLSSLILGMGYLMVAFDDEKRALHDRICDTRVVDKLDRAKLDGARLDGPRP
jgi:uncharacterized RDD family membrane protein YckC